MKRTTHLLLLIAFFLSLLTGCGRKNVETVSVLKQTRSDNETHSENHQGMLPQDASSIRLQGALPDKTSLRYQHIIKKLVDHTGYFNGIKIEGKLQEVEIYAAYIDLSSSSSQNFYNLLKNRTNIKKVTFHAEKIILNDSLYLPGTHIIFNADKLIMGPNAVINTVPKSFNLSPSQFAAGATGQKGGDVTLLVNNLEIKPREKLLFILDGSAGQQGGAGQNGSNGINRAVVKAPNITYYVESKRECNRESGRPLCTHSKITLGTTAWPTDGTDALAGGLPGSGGDGGAVLSPIRINDKYIRSRGGAIGKAPVVSRGGRAGQPIIAKHFINGSVQIYHTKNGKDAVVDTSSLHLGVDGKIVISDSMRHSFSKELVRILTRYAKDVYKSGHIELAQTLFSNIKRSLSNKHDLFLKESFIANKYLYQLKTHCDYYGNPAGWVPTLSLNYYLNKLTQDKERIFNTLYLTYWMKNRVSSIDEKYKIATKLKQLNVSQTEDTLNNLKQLQSDLPSLNQKILELKEHQTLFKKELLELEQKIISQARSELESSTLLKVVRTIGSLATVIPAGQPILGSIGTGMLTVAKMVESDMSINSILTNVPQIYDSLNERSYQQSVKHWNKEWGKIKFSSIQGDDTRDYFDYLNRVAKFMKPISRELERQIDNFSGHEVSNQELQQKIVQLKQSHPQYQKLLYKLKTIVSLRAEVYRELQIKQHLYNSLNQKLLTLTQGHLELEYSIAALSEGMDKNLNVVLQDLEDSSKDELNYQFYLLQKSFEYRFLKPLSAPSAYVELYDRFFHFAQSDLDAELTESQMRTLLTLFDQQLATVKGAIEKELSRRVVYSGDHFEYKLSAAELNTLNQSGRVEIVLTNDYPFNHRMENIRLRDLSIASFNTYVGEKAFISITPIKQFFFTFDGDNFAYNANGLTQWHFVYNPSSQQITKMKRSDNYLGTLQDLFGHNAQLFTLPGAVGSFEISLESLSSQPVDVDELTLLVQPDYEVR